jgi:uroporphyrinogen-III synthase
MRRVLYLGTDPTHFALNTQDDVIHYPVIKIVPRSLDDVNIREAYQALEAYTHLIFTSKNAVAVFCQHLLQLGRGLSALNNKVIIAIGEVTAARLIAHGILPHLTAEEETQEGIVAILKSFNLEKSYVFLPRSALSRPVLGNFFRGNNIRYCACDLYDTVTQKLDQQLDFSQIDEIVFTSPSTVNAFYEIFKEFPKEKKLTAIGPITEAALQNKL